MSITFLQKALEKEACPWQCGPAAKGADAGQNAGNVCTQCRAPRTCSAWALGSLHSDTLILRHISAHVSCLEIKASMFCNNSVPWVESFHQLWGFFQMCTILLGRKSSHAFIQHIFEKLPYTRDCSRFWNRILLWTFRMETTIPGP